MIRKSELKDTERVVEIYELAKAGMRDMGINQWQDGYPNAETFAADINKDISVVMEKDGEVVGTAAAYIGHEPTYDEIFEGEWLTDNKIYGIIHRIAVDPTKRGAGVASSAMSYVYEMCKEKGITSMRCDTHKDNKIMQHTLEKNGYRYCGVIYLENGDPRVAYEKLI